MSKDSIPQSVATGRLLGSLISMILAGYLAKKGLSLSPEETEKMAELFSASFIAMCAAIPPILSKLREARKGA